MVYVRIHVEPGARRERFEKRGEREFGASVREPAERNLANRRVVALVAAHFGVPPRKARLVSGHRSPTKIVDVELGESLPE